MSGYKSFAVWGAGHLGQSLVSELLKLKAAGTIDSVSVLTRPESKDKDVNKKFASQGVSIVPFDVESSDASSALKGIDVLISTVAIPGLQAQYPLIKIAKAAGVKLFVPADWGDNTDGREAAIFRSKAKLREELESIGLPFASFFHGLWIDFLPHVGLDFKNGKITIQGEGNAELSSTHSHDVARFVAYALTALPRDQVEWTKFRIEGDRYSFNGLTEAYQKATGKKLEVTHVPRSTLEENVAKDPNDAFSALFLGWDTGEGVVGKPDQLSNNLFPEWNPQKALDVIQA